MRPSIMQGRRVFRYLVKHGAFLAVVGIVLAWGGGSSSVLAHPGGHPVKADKPYERLRVLNRDWEDHARQVGDPEVTEREQFRQGEYFRRWKEIHDLVGSQHVSRKGQEILRRRGLGSALVAGENGAKGYQPYDGVDTLRVLIVRFGFETNRDSSLTTVQPHGDFDLTIPPDDNQLRVDPPPHNRDFYQAHLEGLSEYYNYQSGGRLHIEGRVLPEAQDESYKLSDPADYGPGEGGGWTLEALERLVRDMIVAADEGTAEDGSASLADYDDDNDFTYIIFVHAGSDWQSDINQDSPNDIPTFFVTLGEPQNLPSSGGSLSECSIIPETTNQDDYPGSIAAAFYHEFGHALGLVDVYNTTTGLPQVGIWDLMDSGTNLPVWLGQENDDGSITQVSATGVLPPSLGIWNKWFLGWVEMEEIDGRSESYHLPAVQVPRSQYTVWDVTTGDFDLSYPQAIKAGPSPREYFLLENRYVPFPDAGGTHTPYDDFWFKKDQATGVVQYLGGTRSGVDYNSGMYDYFLPAGGVLVWHVNNDVIAANLDDNTINANGDGLRILEADGIQDIGVLESYVLGWYGSYRDPYGEESGFQNVYTDAFPSSRMYDRSWSGLALTDIRQADSRSGAVMEFNATITPLAPGYPWEVGSLTAAQVSPAGGQVGPRSLDPHSLTPLTVSGDPLLVFADSPSPQWDGGDYPTSLFALREDGTAAFDTPTDRPVGAFQDLGAPLAGPPIWVAGGAEPQEQLFWATSRGRVGLSLLGEDTASLSWSGQTGDTLLAGPLAAVSEAGIRFTVGAAPDSLFVLEHYGPFAQAPLSLSQELGQAGLRFVGPGLLPTQPGWTQAVAFLDQGLVSLDIMSGQLEIGSLVAYPTAWSGPLRVAMVPQGNETESWVNLWLFADEGSLGGFRVDVEGNMTPLAELSLGEPLVCEPAVADVDGDGDHDLVLASSRRIFGYRGDGVPLRGYPAALVDMFPLESGTTVAGPLLVVDGTGDGVNEVFFNTSGGHLVGISATGELLDRTPFLWGDIMTPGMAVGTPDPLTGQRDIFLLSAGGYTGALMDRLFYNGRIMAYELVTPAEGAGQTSGWYGPRGGSRRGGVEGLGQDLGQLAPLAAEMNRVVTYPNPVTDEQVTLRFYSETAGTARFELYNLEGELVSREDFSVDAGALVEHQFHCGQAVSGMYLGRLIQPAAGGNKIQTITLAVEK